MTEVVYNRKFRMKDTFSMSDEIQNRKLKEIWHIWHNTRSMMYSKIQENICRFRYLVIHYVWFCRFSVKSSLELMLYCFIMCRIKIKFSYLIPFHVCLIINLSILLMQCQCQYCNYTEIRILYCIILVCSL